MSVSYCWTWNNPKVTGAELVHRLDALVQEGKVRFWIFQKEKAPNTGTLHFQGYLQMTRKCQISYLKKHFSPIPHFEGAKGTAEQNVAYCSKEDSRAEGDESEVGPWRGGEMMEQGRRSDIVAFVDSIKAGSSDAELLEKHPKEFVRYFKVIENIRATMAPRRDGPPLVILFTGNPGCGKTRSAVDYAEKRGLKYWIRGPHKNWFQGYQGEPVAILDEVDKYHEQGFSLGLLLRVLDRYAVDVEFKGGSRPFSSNTIIMTAVLPPEAWYTRASDVAEQIGRRITTWYEWDEVNMNWKDSSNKLYRPVKREVPEIEIVDLTGDDE